MFIDNQAWDELDEFHVATTREEVTTNALVLSTTVLITTPLLHRVVRDDVGILWHVLR